MSSEDLRAYQGKNRDLTVERVEAAKAEIKKKIADRGFYPENGGRVSINEVSRVAGIGKSTLKNPTHKTTRTKLQQWLHALRKTAPAAAADPNIIDKDHPKSIAEQIEIIAHNYNKFKIIYDGLLERCTWLEDRNIELEASKADLLHKLSIAESRALNLEGTVAPAERANLIPFPRPKGPSL